mmetsp:Transcript_123132/g.195241  ORF Transcript_123132/g.195241 Transcript_123132/m.195241 type:complete len:645 (+) Transcript_123132:29-1963(+)
MKQMARPSSPTLPLLFLVLAELALAASLDKHRREIASCSCDCCEVGRRREDEQAEQSSRKGGLEIDHFECAYSPQLLFPASAPRCDNLCRQDQSDSVLTSTMVSEIDTQRFCFFECEPSPQKREAPKPGDLCRPLSKKEETEIRDKSGNGRAPMETGNTMGHFLASHGRSTRSMAAVAIRGGLSDTVLDLSGESMSGSSPGPSPGPRPGSAPAQPGSIPVPAPSPENSAPAPANSAPAPNPENAGPAPNAANPAPAPNPANPAPAPNPIYSPAPSPLLALAPAVVIAAPPAPGTFSSPASAPWSAPAFAPGSAPGGAPGQAPSPAIAGSPGLATEAGGGPESQSLMQGGAQRSPGPAAPPGAPWSSISESVQTQAAKVVEWALEAESSAKKAHTEAAKLKKSVGKATGAMESVMAEVGNAQVAMENAIEDADKIHELKVFLWEKAKKSAEDEIPKIMKEIKEKAKKKAEEEAKKKAAAFEKEMKAKAKTESAKAAKVYMDAMAGAGKTSAEYAKIADGLIAQSATAQMNAGLEQQQANQYLTIGDMSEAQRLMQQSRGDMNFAFGLNAQATGMYNTAIGIQNQLPAYAGQAAMAAYHAQVMYDPKAVPPPPPLVFMQHSHRHSKSSPIEIARHIGIKTSQHVEQ